MKNDSERADERRSIPPTYVTGCRALLNKPTCDECKKNPTAVATGDGKALCHWCADAADEKRREQVTSTRLSRQRLAEARKAIEQVKQWPAK